MSFQNTLLMQMKGHLAPESLIRHIMKECPSLVSVSAVDGEKFQMDGLAGAEYTYENVKEFQELLKDSDVVFCFGKYPTEFPEETAPPYIMYEKSTNHPSLLLFTDGDFSNYAKAESSHSPDFFAAQNYFAPKIGKWLEGKDNLTNVMAKLKDDDVVENIQNSFINRGCVLFYAITGEIVCIEKNNDKHQLAADWGFVSNTHGWTAEEEKKEVPKPVEKPVASGSSRFRGSGAVPVVKKEAAEEKLAPKSVDAATAGKAEEKVTKSTVREKPSVVGGSDKEEKDATLITMLLEPTFRLGASKEEKKQWYRDNNNGVVPSGFKDRPAIARDVPRAQLERYLSEGWKPKDTSIRLTPPKDVGKKHIPASKDVAHNEPLKDEYKSFSSDKEGRTTVGVRSVEQQKELQAEFKTILGINSNELSVDPGNIHSTVEKLPSAFDQAGQKNVSCLFYLSPDNLTNLRVKYPEWFDLAVLQMRGMLYKELEASGKLKAMMQQPSETEKEEVQQEEKEKPKVAASGGSRFLRKSA